MTIDAALVDALADALAETPPHAAFIERLGLGTIRRLREAGVEKPNRTMRQRLGLLKQSERESLS